MIRRFPGLIGAKDMRDLTENFGFSTDLDFVEAPAFQQRDRRLDKFIIVERISNRLTILDPRPDNQRAGMINFPIPFPVLPARRSGDAFIERVHDFIDSGISGHQDPILSVHSVRHLETGLFAPQVAFAYRKARLPRSVQSALIRTVGV